MNDPAPSGAPFAKRAMRRFVHLETSVPGFHYWPDAPISYRYLESYHRHLFVVKADVAVQHSDRAIEINEATARLTQELQKLGHWMRTDVPWPVGTRGELDFDGRSCEDIAEHVAAWLCETYGLNRWVRVAVLEDGILGGGIEVDGPWSVEEPN